MIKTRYLTKPVIADLEEKMVFIGGPRQVGKTTLSTHLIGKKFRNSAYYNWDYREDRQKILASDWPGSAELIILDEIHKYKKWKNHIKGEYDKLKANYKFLVTGSARLDVYRKGGDSLQGRYHYYRMHPFSLAEILNQNNKPVPLEKLNFSDKVPKSGLNSLLKFGGFPEPFLKQEETSLRRWHNQKIDRMFKEEIRNMENIRDLDNMVLLSDLLPGKIGSLLSINSLRNDIEVSHRAITSWLKILESFYYHFRIYPYTGRIINSIKKDSKLYLLDWSEIDDESVRFENMIASHLLKLVHFLEDNQGYKAKLYFLRNVKQKEVDFLVTIKEKPWFAVEVKLNDENISPNLHYFGDRLKIPYMYQVIRKPGIDRLKNGVRLISAELFLSGLV